ncbi:MAG: heme exporter protein CcmD [Zoogloeaceae bacterium]|jgi:heme exporter protein D|nr:heme exporter protein CcmD [Zoogloeaceae bacterium]
MHWNSFSDFLHMGGYGLYVWGSFGIAALGMVLEPLLVARQRRVTLARLARQWRAERLEKTPEETTPSPGEAP